MKTRDMVKFKSLCKAFQKIHFLANVKNLHTATIGRKP